ncbi:winged helix-turn-helix transcriptional regulator [Chryseolinea lacunae]|uniref:winged helix-turn-helix transcriptional regulator n=1 Tax=Chryseolinea lacunae TaxID=2801331 RepID=UPI001F2DE0E3|nr:helix-turn-helix domain-containing protein [Chryseolinea lacunae]
METTDFKQPGKQNASLRRTKKEFPSITERILILQLRALENDGLLTRTVYAEVPPRVEYELTAKALELTPILKQLSEWGGKHRN